MGNRKNMPSKKKIFKYWAEKKPEITSKHVDQNENTCFACGRQQVDRAHIIPHWKSKDDSVENLHLICRYCHGFQEGKFEIIGEGAYYHWLINEEFWLSKVERHLASYYKSLNEEEIRDLENKLKQEQ
jgi:hypothetical protein